MLDDPEGGARALEKAPKLDAENPALSLNLAAEYDKLGEAEKSADAMERSRKHWRFWPPLRETATPGRTRRGLSVTAVLLPWSTPASNFGIQNVEQHFTLRLCRRIDTEYAGDSRSEV